MNEYTTEKLLPDTPLCRELITVEIIPHWHFEEVQSFLQCCSTSGSIDRSDAEGKHWALILLRWD